jgi:hypothetical protein
MESRDGKQLNKLGINFFLDKECRRIVTTKGSGEQRQEYGGCPSKEGGHPAPVPDRLLLFCNIFII